MKKTDRIGSRGVTSAMRLAAFPARRQLAQLLHLYHPCRASTCFRRRNPILPTYVVSADGWKQAQILRGDTSGYAYVY